MEGYNTHCLSLHIAGLLAPKLVGVGCPNGRREEREERKAIRAEKGAKESGEGRQRQKKYLILGLLLYILVFYFYLKIKNYFSIYIYVQVNMSIFMSNN